MTRVARCKAGTSSQRDILASPKGTVQNQNLSVLHCGVRERVKQALKSPSLFD